MKWIVFTVFLAVASVGCNANAGRLAVVQVEKLRSDDNPAGRGTGFFVTRDLVMTNHHVVQNARGPVIVNHRRYKVWGRVVAIEEHLDLALIKVEGSGPRPLRFCRNVQEGDEVAAWTFDFGRFRRKEGMIEAQWFHRVTTTVGLIPGNSGSPIIKGGPISGCVAGVAKSVSWYDFRGIATSAFAAESFLKVYLDKTRGK